MFFSEYKVTSFTTKLKFFLIITLKLSVLNFVYDNDVKDLCNFEIIGFESHFEIFWPRRHGS